MIIGANGTTVHMLTGHSYSQPLTHLPEILKRMPQMGLKFGRNRKMKMISLHKHLIFIVLHLIMQIERRRNDIYYEDNSVNSFIVGDRSWLVSVSSVKRQMKIKQLQVQYYAYL